MKGFGKLLIVLLAVMIFIFICIYIVPSFFGVRAEVVQAWEASGEFSYGDLIYIVETHSKDILLGETAIQDEDGVRRFYKITRKNKVTAESDLEEPPAVTFDGTIDKVALRVPGLGYGLVPFQSFLGTALVFLSFASLLAAGILFIRYGTLRDRRRQSRRRGPYKS